MVKVVLPAADVEDDATRILREKEHLNIALLGIDDEAVALVREIARDSAHRLQFFAPAIDNSAADKEVAAAIAEVRVLCPQAELVDHWERLLAPGICDAVVVAGPRGFAERFEQLRRFVQERIPVFATHPPSMALIEAYELEMVRQEVDAPLWSLLVVKDDFDMWYGKEYPLVEVPEIAQAPLVLKNLLCERYVSKRTREGVLGALARDIDFIRDLCGEISQVATLSGHEATTQGSRRDWTGLTVELQTAWAGVVRWSAEPAGTWSGLRVRTSGEDCSHTVAIREKPEGAEIEYTVSRQWQPDVTAQWRSSGYRLSMIAGRTTHALAGFKTHSNWTETIRTLELVEAVEKSLRKGRTISVGVEGRTESDAFKGTMASVGCVLLIVGLLVVIGSAVMLKIAEKVGNQALVNIFKWWPALLVGIFGVFLVLQLLRFIIPKTPTDEERHQPEA